MNAFKAWNAKIRVHLLQSSQRVINQRGYVNYASSSIDVTEGIK